MFVMNDNLEKYEKYWKDEAENNKLIEISVGNLKLHQNTIKSLRDLNYQLNEKNIEMERELKDIKRKYDYDDFKFKIIKYSIILAVSLIMLLLLVSGIAEMYIKLSLIRDLGGDGIQAIRDVASIVFNK